MTGAEIVGRLLRARTDLTAIIPVAGIKLGRLPEGIELPCLLIRTVNEVERLPLRAGGTFRVMERVSATVRAATYRDQGRVIDLLRPFRVDFIAAIEGAERVSILPAGIGPDLNGPGNSFERARDWRVSFDTPS